MPRQGKSGLHASCPRPSENSLSRAPRTRTITWLGLGLAGLMLAACASAPARPPAPVYSGQPRMEPDTGQPGQAQPAIETPVQTQVAAPPPLRGPIPPNLRGRDIVRAAVLLPFTSSSSGARAEAQGLLAGIELALFDHAGNNILLIPVDTGGTAEGATRATRKALSDGADIIIGPLFSEAALAATALAQPEGVPVLSFSNDSQAGGEGAYLVSISPEEEVERVVDWASLKGVTAFAILAPDTPYGRRVGNALRFEVTRRGGQMLAAEYYPAGSTSPQSEARRVASAVRPVANAQPGKVAVMIPEQGSRLRAVAPLLPYFDVPMSRIKLLGTGLWNDPSITRELTLRGGVFAAPTPADLTGFESDFTAAYGAAPSRLASLGYDAGSLAIGLAKLKRFDRNIIEQSDGFFGANGLFRFRVDGTAQRGLAILEVTPNGFVVIEPAPRTFDPKGS
jgi:ABC-type branched-subunit amino acid transport system substrate-binding protein